MAQCYCRTMCWDNGRLYYPYLKTPDGKEFSYDIDPAAPIAKHFEFTDPAARDIQKANVLMQQKASLERSVKTLRKTVADQLADTEAQLEHINEILQHDIPNKDKAAVSKTAGMPFKSA